MKWAVIAALSVWSDVTPAASEVFVHQERTKDSAHAFLENAFSRNVEFGYLGRVRYYSPAGCLGVLHITAGNGTDEAVVIEYGKISGIQTNYSGGLMFVYLPVTYRNQGYSDDNMYLEVGTAEMRDRVSAAMLFLRDQCDTSRSTGF